MSPESPHPSREDLFAYRDGELTAERRVLIEAHVVTCRPCRELIDQVSHLEAALKGRPDSVDDEYFERLTADVLRRVAAEAPAPRAERRRSETAPAPVEGGARPRPRLFWPAVISTASAAAGILVVILLVAREGPFWQPSPRITTVEESAPDAGRPRTAADSVVALAPAPAGAKKEADQRARAGERPAAPGAPAVEKAKLDGRDEFLKETAEAKRSDAETESRAKDQVAMGQAAPRSAAPSPSAPAPAEATIGGVAARQNAADAASPQFESIRRRYGLPPDWGPGVSDEMVLRAEGPLRNLYRTGGATTALDSARVRLYLAEAARTRVGSSPDSSAIDEIAHHYRRVVRLAGPESATGRIAAERLADFLREVGLTP